MFDFFLKDSLRPIIVLPLLVMRIYLNILIILFLTGCLYVNCAPIEANQNNNNISAEAISNSTGTTNVSTHGTKQRPKANSRLCGDFEIIDCGFVQI